MVRHVGQLGARSGWDAAHTLAGPRPKVQQALRRRTGLLPAREKWMWSGQMGTESVIEIRKGQAPAELSREPNSASAFARPSSTRRSAPKSRPSRASKRSRGRPTREGRKAPLTQQGRRRAMPIPTTTYPSNGLPRKQRIDEAQQRWGDPATPVAGAAGLRLGAQRRHLPGRDLQDLPPAQLAREDAGRRAASRPTCWT